MEPRFSNTLKANLIILLSIKATTLGKEKNYIIKKYNKIYFKLVLISGLSYPLHDSVTVFSIMYVHIHVLTMVHAFICNLLRNHWSGDTLLKVSLIKIKNAIFIWPIFFPLIRKNLNVFSLIIDVKN